MLLSRFLGQLDVLIPKGSRLLLAVSGGRDSVVLEAGKKKGLSRFHG